MGDEDRIVSDGSLRSVTKTMDTDERTNPEGRYNQ